MHESILKKPKGGGTTEYAYIDDAEGRLSVEEDGNSTYKHVEELSFLHWDLPKHEGEDDFYYEEHDGASCCVMEEEDIEAKFEKITEISSISGDGEEEEREVSMLKLNYENVLSTWSDRRPLYTDNDRYPLPMAATSGCSYMVEERARREASLMRYKEKRRTRLFFQKIRYKVRKVNANERPRLKVLSLFFRLASEL